MSTAQQYLGMDFRLIVRVLCAIGTSFHVSDTAGAQIVFVGGDQGTATVTVLTKPNSSDIFQQTLHQGQGTSELKAFYLIGVPPPADHAQYAIAGGGALGGVLLLCLAVFCVALWVMKDRWRNLNDEEIHEFFKGNGSDGEGRRPTSAWDLPYDVEKEIAKEELRVGALMGKGQFGRVYHATLHKPGAGEEAGAVAAAVKKNIPFLSIAEFKASMYELKLLIHLGHHDNVVKLLGAHTARVGKRQLSIVFEYCEFGDLKTYLRNNRTQIVLRIASVPRSLSAMGLPPRRYVASANELCLANVGEMGLLNWILQILVGLLFLGSKQVVHGDVAARNVLLKGPSLTAKISDFGMSHQITDATPTYVSSSQVKKPWWSTAPECLERCEFSVKSDVYSFGVLLWELFTLGDDPWAADGMEAMLEALKRGEGLPMPTFRNLDPQNSPSHSQGKSQRVFEVRLATDDIYERMSHCQRLDPAQRPTFQELHEHFEGLVRSVTHLVASRD